jgi:hypothetical protein
MVNIVVTFEAAAHTLSRMPGRHTSLAWHVTHARYQPTTNYLQKRTYQAHQYLALPDTSSERRWDVSVAVMCDLTIIAARDGVQTWNPEYHVCRLSMGGGSEYVRGCTLWIPWTRCRNETKERCTAQHALEGVLESAVEEYRVPSRRTEECVRHQPGRPCLQQQDARWRES